ncbi:MAG: hypothetical protein GXC70_01255 [Sphingomonadaceae bacterium]|nr:hypothetical protein [Sphingomonadaceae bacterium]
MRLSPPLTILTMVAAGFGALAANRSREVKIEATRVERSCDLLVSFMQAETKGLGSNFMVVDFPEQSPEPEEVESWIRQGLVVDRISIRYLARQLARYRAEMTMPSAACPALRTWLSKQRIKVNSPEAEAILRAARLHDADLPLPIYSIAMPALTPDGDEGLLRFIVAREDPHGGFFEVWATRNDQGAWTYEYFDIGGVP